MLVAHSRQPHTHTCTQESKSPTNLAKMHHPPKRHDGNHRAPHRRPNNTHPRLLNIKRIQIIAPRPIRLQPISPPRSPIRPIQPHPREKRRHRAPDAKGQINQAGLPLIQGVEIDQQNRQRRIDARVHRIQQPAGKDHNGIVSAGEHGERFQRVGYPPGSGYHGVGVRPVLHHRDSGDRGELVGGWWAQGAVADDPAAGLGEEDGH